MTALRAGDRVFVVKGPWQGYAGAVIGQERVPVLDKMFVRVRLDIGSDTLSPPDYFKKAAESFGGIGVEADTAPVSGEPKASTLARLAIRCIVCSEYTVRVLAEGMLLGKCVGCGVELRDEGENIFYQPFAAIPRAPKDAG